MRKLRSEGPLATYRTVTQPARSTAAAGLLERRDRRGGGRRRDRLRARRSRGVRGRGLREPRGAGGRARRTSRRACPTALALEKAAFATLGAIALQGLRVAEPALGEICAVIGLGAIGQLAVQLLVANGCRVLGVDLDAARAKQALDLGARVVARARRRSRELDRERDWRSRRGLRAGDGRLGELRTAAARGASCAGCAGGSSRWARPRWISTAAASTTRSCSSA